jgi:AcrR family transcriptional regulator
MFWFISIPLLNDRSPMATSRPDSGLAGDLAINLLRLLDRVKRNEHDVFSIEASISQTMQRHESRSTRERRARILDQAKSLIAAGGIESLSVRTLAESADVAVRTIYRLIGTKDEVLVELFSRSQQLWEQRISAMSGCDPLEMIEALAIEAASLYSEDEEYHRSAYLAIEHLYEAQPRHETVDRIFKNARVVLINAFRACVEAGLLEGKVSAWTLGSLALQLFRDAGKDWAAGRATINELRRETLSNAYIVLLVDGTPEFRKLIQAKLAAIT